MIILKATLLTDEGFSVYYFFILLNDLSDLKIYNQNWKFDCLILEKVIWLLDYS